VAVDAATSLRRGILVLRALGSGEALGVLQIARLVGQDKSQVSRTLKTLSEYGLVDRDPETRAYRLGWGVFELAARAGDMRLVTAGESVVSALAQSLGERVHLSVLHGVEVLTLLSRSTSRAIEASGWAGRTVPAYCTSAGYVLLLDTDVRRLLAGVELVRLAPNTPRSLDEVVARVGAARELGYSVADEDFEPGLIGIAAPVRDFRGRVAAALNVSAPKFRLEARIAELGAAVTAAAASLSALVGALPSEKLSV
jgi:DNA-binding IclR family transcriptional regulator